MIRCFCLIALGLLQACGMTQSVAPTTESTSPVDSEKTDLGTEIGSEDDGSHTSNGTSNGGSDESSTNTSSTSEESSSIWQAKAFAFQVNEIKKHIYKQHIGSLLDGGNTETTYSCNSAGSAIVQLVPSTGPVDGYRALVDFDQCSISAGTTRTLDGKLYIADNFVVATMHSEALFLESPMDNPYSGYDEPMTGLCALAISYRDTTLQGGDVCEQNWDTWPTRPWEEIEAEFGSYFPESQ